MIRAPKTQWWGLSNPMTDLCIYTFLNQLCGREKKVSPRLYIHNKGFPQIGIRWNKKNRDCFFIIIKHSSFSLSVYSSIQDIKQSVQEFPDVSSGVYIYEVMSGTAASR